MPFRSRLLLRSGNGNSPSIALANDGTCGGESCERVAETLVSHVELGAELGAAEGRSRAHEGLEEAAIESGVIAKGGDRRITINDREMRVGLAVDNEAQAERIGRRRSAVLDREHERVLLSPKIEIRVAPRVKIATAAKR